MIFCFGHHKNQLIHILWLYGAHKYIAGNVLHFCCCGWTGVDCVLSTIDKSKSSPVEKRGDLSRWLSGLIEETGARSVYCLYGMQSWLFLWRLRAQICLAVSFG